MKYLFHSFPIHLLAPALTASTFRHVLFSHSTIFKNAPQKRVHYRISFCFSSGKLSRIDKKNVAMAVAWLCMSLAHKLVSIKRRGSSIPGFHHQHSREPISPLGFTFHPTIGSAADLLITIIVIKRTQFCIIFFYIFILLFFSKPLASLTGDKH